MTFLPPEYKNCNNSLLIKLIVTHIIIFNVRNLKVSLAFSLTLMNNMNVFNYLFFLNMRGVNNITCAAWFAEWYGNDTGIMYINRAYGNLKPDVPKVQIETPKIFNTYIYGKEFSTIFRKLPLQKAASRIIGDITVNVTVENTNFVEFYIDNVKHHTDYEFPFTCDIHSTRGLYTLEVRAYNKNSTSIDLIDFYVII